MPVAASFPPVLGAPCPTWIITTYALNTTGDVTSMRDALNEETTYVWSQGLLQSQTDPLNHTTTFQWDSAHRLLLDTIDPNNDRSSFGYDAYGDQAVVTDPLNHTTTSVFRENKGVRFGLS